MTDVNEILKACKVEGLIVKLPDVQLDRAVYLDVKKKMELIGGKWTSGRTQGFVFKQDPRELLGQVANGEKRNLKKEYQFFPTPDAVADQLVQLAKIEEYHKILEPSAGQGAIVNAILRAHPRCYVDCYELMDLNHTFLRKIAKVRIVGFDFLEHSRVIYDRIVANPPFTKNQDIDHIKKMYDALARGGRLVSVASTHWQNTDGKKEKNFREWLNDRNAEVTSLPRETFKESGTVIETRIIIINKP